ncbi:MAG TPA: hypothetical protein P5316_16595 [Phycisphaerae bacterium]|nr:hypothetical protein [Phycisphaerae bacterium]
MSRSSQRRGDGNSADESTWSSLRANVRAFRPIVSAVFLVAFLVSVVAGLERLERHVTQEPGQKTCIRVELDVPPDMDWVDKEGWRPRILSSVRVPQEPLGADESLLQNIARQLLDSGWVSQVRRVVYTPDGTIRITCDCRRPIAMLLTEQPGNGRPIYVPVDKHGYRLPETYVDISGCGAWIQILGVKAKPPEVGRPFEADDAKAGIKLAALIFQQSFHSQVAAVDVTNHRGRVNKAKSHILIHPRAKKSEAFHWGSAIGEEIEEPSASEKLRMLAKCFAPGSPQASIDLSVYSNAGIERAPDTTPKADALASRRKQ